MMASQRCDSFPDSRGFRCRRHSGADSLLIRFAQSHETMEAQMKSRNQFRQQFAKMPTVACVAINRPSFIAARGEMIPTARPLDAQESGH